MQVQREQNVYFSHWRDWEAVYHIHNWRLAGSWCYWIFWSNQGKFLWNRKKNTQALRMVSSTKVNFGLRLSWFIPKTGQALKNRTVTWQLISDQTWQKIVWIGNRGPSSTPNLRGLNSLPVMEENSRLFYHFLSNEPFRTFYTQWASHPRPQISTWIYGGISGDHPRRNLLIIFLRKFRRNKGEFFMRIFPPLFPRESPSIFPHGNFPPISLQMSKCHKRTYKWSQLWKNIPVMFKCQFLGELEGLQVWGNFPLFSTWNFGRNLGVVSA